jgi:hypothetical protein
VTEVGQFKDIPDKHDITWIYLRVGNVLLVDELDSFDHGHGQVLYNAYSDSSNEALKCPFKVLLCDEVMAPISKGMIMGQ